MTYNRLGVTNPLLDALRVATLAASGALAENVSSGAGWLYHKITYLKATDDTIYQFDADEAGLDDALALAGAGDTIWLPSRTIAIAAAKTIPAGAALAGIDANAILSYSGFSGTALTLSDDSIAYNFTLNFTSNGTTAIGIDATSSGAIIDHVDATVSGGSASNIAKLIGVATDFATEVWSMYHKVGIGIVIVWSDDYTFLTATNDTTWNLINSWPTGFDDTTSTGDEHRLAMRHDGSEFYIMHDAGGIWRCTNVAAIRAAPATAPTWEALVEVGDTVTSETVTSIHFIDIWDDSLVATIEGTNLIYGEYISGSGWTWYNSGLGGFGTQQIRSAKGLAASSFGAGVDQMRIYDPPNSWATLCTIASDFGEGFTNRCWRNDESVSSDAYAGFWAGSSTHIINATTGADIYDTAYAGATKLITSLRGAVVGPQIYVITPDGVLHTSSDGVSFTARATWAVNGSISDVLDHRLSGGGSLIWSNGASSAGQINRVSLDGGDTFSDKTGDFWTVIVSAPSGVSFKGMQLVLPS